MGTIQNVNQSAVVRHKARGRVNARNLIFASVGSICFTVGIFQGDRTVRWLVGGSSASQYLSIDDAGNGHTIKVLSRIPAQVRTMVRTAPN